MLETIIQTAAILAILFILRDIHKMMGEMLIELGESKNEILYVYNRDKFNLGDTFKFYKDKKTYRVVGKPATGGLLVRKLSE